MATRAIDINTDRLDPDMALGGNQATQISMTPNGSKALRHQHGFRWQCRLLTLVCSLTPSHLQFHIPPQCTKFSASLSLPSLHYALHFPQISVIHLFILVSPSAQPMGARKGTWVAFSNFMILI